MFLIANFLADRRITIADAQHRLWHEWTENGRMDREWMENVWMDGELTDGRRTDGWKKDRQRMNIRRTDRRRMEGRRMDGQRTERWRMDGWRSDGDRMDGEQTENRPSDFYGSLVMLETKNTLISKNSSISFQPKTKSGPYLWICTDNFIFSLLCILCQLDTFVCLYVCVAL